MIAHSKPCLGEEEIQAVERVIRSGNLAQGEEVKSFEEECARYFGWETGIATHSGTAALHLVLAALGIGSKETVAFPSYACAALLQAVSWQNARPVLCDIGSDYNLDPTQPPWNAAAVIVPHMFGSPAKMPGHACVIEDLAQSMGNNTGRSSQIAITSFYATKLLTTGEGGMVFTDDKRIAEQIRDMRDYDNRDDFKIRYSYKMTDFQAAMGRVQLKRLQEFIEKRRAIAGLYSEAFRDLPIRLPNAHPEHVYFRYVVATAARESFETYLSQRGVEAKRPVYHPAHHYLGGEYPNSEQAHRECLSLPIYPALSSQEIEFVVESVIKFFA